MGFTEKLKEIGVTAPKRISVLPNVETVSEPVLQEFSFTAWGELFAPKGTLRLVLEQLNQEIKSQLEADSIAVPTNTMQEFNDFI